MPLKRIIVPVNLSREPKFILEYASNLALVSNAKLSCICHGGEESGKSIRHRSEAIKKDGHLMLSYVRTINENTRGKKNSIRSYYNFQWDIQEPKKLHHHEYSLFIGY